MDGVIPALKDPHKSVTVRPPQTPFQLVSRGPPSQSAQAGGKKGLLRGGVRPRGQPSPAPRCSSRFYSQEQSLGAPLQCWDSGWHLLSTAVVMRESLMRPILSCRINTMSLLNRGQEWFVPSFYPLCFVNRLNLAHRAPVCCQELSSSLAQPWGHHQKVAGVPHLDADEKAKALQTSQDVVRFKVSS